uniref:Uncharacterized protein n=1 Tax=Rousettus aegyptiacus TaxID=9407 RepID=A0A7J8KAP8_ROUAE|nr:hypothetical protein HJG63_007823 [Rousettus aegyptiacus]
MNQKLKPESGRGLVQTPSRSVAQLEPEYRSPDIPAGAWSNPCQLEHKAQANRELTTFKLWAHPLNLGAGSLFLRTCSQSLLVGGQLSHSMAPAATPALDLLSGSLSSGAVNSRMRVLGHTGRAPSAGCACGLGWAQDLLLMTQYFRVQAAGLCVLQQVNYRLSKSKIK